ncbi:2426_t:CDS:2 [Paraglomus brasilianum]|uniref:2426_t:CDS:1 n=1 Tax=Paraglomus brasilianum TaxID=144538 RepID=A0A9N9AJH6_9GLOM|nr:2426_t:CDS:2 [Paraglomus brasilianum]
MASRTATFATLRGELFTIMGPLNLPSDVLPPIPERSPSEYIIDYCQGPCDRNNRNILKKSLDDKWRKKGDKYLVEKHKIKPIVMETLLRYLCYGIIDWSLISAGGVVSLLELANECRLTSLVTVLQTTALLYASVWFEESIVNVLGTAFSSTDYPALRTNLIRLMNDNPWWICDNKELAALEESILIKILTEKKYVLKETLKLELLIRWSLARYPNIPHDVSEWSVVIFDTLRESVSDCISYIQFSAISRNDYYEKILLYKELMPENINDPTLAYYISEECSGPEKLAKRPKVILHDSYILNHTYALKIVNWIEGKEAKRASLTGQPSLKAWRFGKQHTFRLLYRAGRDGRSHRSYHALCDNKGPVVIVGRIIDTNTIVGGYNPVDTASHASRTRVLGDRSPLQTVGFSRKPFIFSFGAGDDPKGAIVSRMMMGESLNTKIEDPCFGCNDLKFELSSMKGVCMRNVYNKDIVAENEFMMDECEVFQVISG